MVKHVGDTVSIAFESNGKGYIGFIVELPGAFIRGRTQQEALAKVPREVNSYLRWLHHEEKHDHKIEVVQRHESSLMVEDADNEILLDADRAEMAEQEFRDLVDLVQHSGETFVQLYTSSDLKDWIDESRIRKTFYGENPKTIRGIFDHVNRCQYYYLSRVEISFEEREADFMGIRRSCLERLGDSYGENNNRLVYEADGELWTLRKVLRRFIWHDRIHARAMTRILDKQRQLGLIDQYKDPFRFM